MENPKDSTQKTLKDFAYRQGDLFLETCLALKNKGENVFLDSQFSEIASGLQRLMAACRVQIPTDLIAGLPAEFCPNDIFRQLQAAIYDGTAPVKFPIGTIIPDTWHERNKAYYMPHVIAHYGEALLESGDKVFGAFLLRRYVFPQVCCFDECGRDFYPKSDCQRLLNSDYEHGCSFELMEATRTIIIPMEMSNGATENIPARFFPPTLENLHFNPYYRPNLEELTWDYFRDSPTDREAKDDKRVFCHPTTHVPQSCLLRSKYRDCHGFIWKVNRDGSAVYARAKYNAFVAPACFVVGKRPFNAAPAATSVNSEPSPSLAPA